MSEENAPNDTNEPDLPAIDFQSPGRFAVHNPPLCLAFSITSRIAFTPLFIALNS